jgi:hypothetical protein
VRAYEVFQNAPVVPHIERHRGRGRRLLCIALPLWCCQAANRRRHTYGWQDARYRREVLGVMARLVGEQAMCCRNRVPELGRVEGYQSGAGKQAVNYVAFERPLSGRPMFRAVRFSSVEPDPTAGWWKVPQDLLLPRRKRNGRMVDGFGLLADDRPNACETRTWWEPAKQGQGFVLMEVWSGDNEHW